MRTAVAGFLFLAAGVVGMATAADGLTGSWRSHPVPANDNVVVEFFEDGTALYTYELTENKKRSRLIRVQKTKEPGLVEFTELEEESVVWATFQIKAPGVAVLVSRSTGEAVRMIPGGIDD